MVILTKAQFCGKLMPFQFRKAFKPKGEFVMITKEFIQGIFARTPGLGMPLVLVFKANANVREAMVSLLRLEKAGIVSIDRDMLVVLAMAESDDFDRAENRNVHVRLRRGYMQIEAEAFAESLAVHLEGINHDNEHGLMSLQSGRQKRREEALKEIESKWISKELRDQVTEWGLKLVVGYELGVGNFHTCKITVLDGDDVVGSVMLDGWSGLLRHGDTWVLGRQATPEKMNAYLLRDIEEHFEALTA